MFKVECTLQKQAATLPNQLKMNRTKEAIYVILNQGGKVEFARTGIYPQYLHFHSELHNRCWNHKLKGDTKEGVLKIEGKVLYSYRFSFEGCVVIKPNGQEIEVVFSHQLCD